MNIKHFAVINFFLCSIGLIGLAKGIAVIVVSAFLGEKSLILNEYLTFFFHPEKRYELVAYLLGAAFLFSYYVFGFFNGCRIIKLHKNIFKYLSKPAYRYIYLAFVCGFNIILMQSYKSYTGTIIGILFWLIIVLYPFLADIFQRTVAMHINICHEKFHRLLLVGILLQACIAFYPYISNDYKFMNEYLDIPEETYIGDSYISNIEYFNKHQLINSANRYNLDSDSGHNPKPILSANITKTKLLNSFIKNNHTRYYYDENIKALCVVGLVSVEDRDLLCSIMQTEKEKKAIKELYFSSKLSEIETNNKRYTKEEIDFLQKNRFEFHWQILNRWMIHHHNFILGPINEYALGKDLNNIFMQYGWLNIVFLKNVMELLGGITYNNYFMVLFSFYFLYYSCFVGITYWIFRKISYTLAITALVFASQNSIGFQFLFLGPGMNPIRHFFDIFVFALFYSYCKQGHLKYLIPSLLLCLVAIINNNQFGLFLLVALVIAAAIKCLQDSYKAHIKDIMLLIASSILGLVIFVFGKIGPDYMSKYYSAGLLGFPLSTRASFLILTFLSLGYLILIKSYKYKGIQTIPGLFLLIYSQELLIYYVWGGVIDHFQALAPIYALTAVFLLKILIDDNNLIKKHEKVITTILIIISFCFYIPSVGKYYKTKREFDKVFDTHQTYQWDMERGHFISTMNPKYFEDSIQLIQKYSSQNGIYMISKYDAFLPFMAKRYNAMPYFEMSQFLITNDEMQKVIDTVNNEQPQFLFVDTDIDRSLNTDIVNPKAQYIGYLHEESKWRVQRLNLLKDVFNAVREDYEPIEQALLITVYRKKI